MGVIYVNLCIYSLSYSSSKHFQKPILGTMKHKWPKYEVNNFNPWNLGKMWNVSVVISNNQSLIFLNTCSIPNILESILGNKNGSI